MTKTIHLLTFFLFWGLTAYGQEYNVRRIPLPYSPPLIGIQIDSTKKNNSDSVKTESLINSETFSYYNPTAPPEAARAIATSNVPVHLYTGSPSINLPIYTLIEGRLNIPLSINYTHSAVKPTTVAGWTGLGFELSGVPSLTRMIRGFPDEGYLDYEGRNFVGRKGYYFYGNAIVASDKKQDKEPDYFFVSTPSGSGKFVFKPRAGLPPIAHFFPEADIKVEVSSSTVSEGGNIAKRFSWFKFTFPDGVSYTFSASAPEESAEIDALEAKNNGVYPYPFNPNPTPFTDFVKIRMIPSAWSCTKIESAYGEKIDLTYQRVAYTYYRLAESESNSLCPTGVGTKINKVYVRSSLLSSITSSSIEVNFNTGYQTCTYNEETGTTECDHSGAIARLDLDSWGNKPTNSSTSGKLLKSITVRDLNSNSLTEQLNFTFDYEYFNSTQEVSLPSGYSATDIGTTHKRRLKLKYINYPGGDRHTFYYHNDNGNNLPSRFTFSVDHWGYRNSYQVSTSNLGYIGKDDLSTCGTDRSPDFTYAQDQLLTYMSHSSGNEIYFEYELNQAKNYSVKVGGLRIKSIITKDNVRNLTLKKNYDYTLPNGSSSGFLFIRPIYRINHEGLDNKNHAISNLYDYLYAESGRPIVGYSRVVETTSDQDGNSITGKQVSYFDQDETEGTIKQSPQCTLSCLTNPIYFNLRQPDLRAGQLLKSETYNHLNQLVQKTENTYTSSGGINSGSTYCVQWHPNSRAYGDYYLYFKKFRLESQVNTTYSTNNLNLGISNSVSYTYKDQMPENYRNKYKGTHNLPVLTTTQDEEGNRIESRVLYTFDFNFDADTTYGCYPDFFCPGNFSCPNQTCSYMDVWEHVPPYGSAGRGIYESIKKNILVPIETTNQMNGQTISATYNTLFSNATKDLTLPYSSYSLKKKPKANFESVYYRKSDNAMIKDSDYGEAPDYLILSYNENGFVVDSKSNKASLSRTTYITPVLPQGSIANYGKSDALTTSSSISKKYLGVDKIVSPNLLERNIDYQPSTGRPISESDKNNRITKRFDYHLNTSTTSTISWNEASVSKSCSDGITFVFLYIDGISSPTQAQYSTDNGLSWQNSNLLNNGFLYTEMNGLGNKTFLARASNNHDNVISKTLDLSCNQSIPFSWGNNLVNTYEVSPLTCKYTLEVNGLTPNGKAQFSIDNLNFHDAQIGDNKTQFVLFAAPSTQQFWARDSNNTSNVITVNLNVCKP